MLIGGVLLLLIATTRTTIAVLVQTLSVLHGHAQLAHLDLSGSNVMLRTAPSDQWDSVCLLDFGFSARCKAGIFL